MMVPPELDEICVKATAVSPWERYQSVREMHEAIERYLDGERDHALRHELAQDHAAAAVEATERMRRTHGVTIEHRRKAMRDVGRALALDTENPDALKALVVLLTEPPEEIPAEVEKDLARSDDEVISWGAWGGVTLYAGLFLYIPVLIWAGIRHVPTIVAFYALAFVSAAVSLHLAVARRKRLSVVLVAMMASNLCFMSTWPFFGGLLVPPGLIIINTASFALAFRGWRRTATIIFAGACILAAVLFDHLGMPATSYLCTESGMTVRPVAIGLGRLPVTVLLYVVGVAMISMLAFYVANIRSRLRLSERTLELGTWQIQQLVPRGPQTGVATGEDP
jgi:serine/threonine-protein kinase